MKAQRMVLVITVAALIAATGFVADANKPDPTPQPEPPREHKLKVMKVQNKWKVVDAADTTRTLTKAKKGEKLVWTAEGSDVYFQFMDDKLVGNYTRTLKAGQKLTLTVGNGAKAGPNAYAVFCIADKEYATGDSPPVIIIE